MKPEPLSQFVSQLWRSLKDGVENAADQGSRLQGLQPRRLTFRLQVRAETTADGGFAFAPVTSGSDISPTQTHEVTLEWDSAAPTRPAARQPSKPALPEEAAPSAGTPVNRETMRRRLELVLGGPPGFTTGARAEILIDLLREFGPSDLIASLETEWVSQFDTGPSASSSVSKPPPPPAEDGNGEGIGRD